MTVEIVSADEGLLLAQVARRSWWLGAVVVSAFAVSLVGILWMARAQQRQAALNVAKDNFVSSVSHELRAPIASIRLLADNLESGKIEGEGKQREYLGMIGQETRRLSSLIANVLDFARMEESRKEYAFEALDAGRLVAETVKLMEPVAQQRGVRLGIGDESHESHLSEAVWDGGAVQRALINLIDNAVKHSDEGQMVSVTTGVGPGSSSVEITVSDDGPGIPVEDRQRIFERFYRRGSELRRETEGIGIGLSIARHIVESHGGELRVESVVGQGSRFTMALPLDAGSGRTVSETGLGESE